MDSHIISVVVPTYNRLASLKFTLESLFRQDYPDREIIVVNDGSTDGTDEFLSELSRQDKILYITQSNKGPAAARNAGVARARGQHVAFTDDDCVVPNNWLRRFAEEFGKSGADIIGGTVRNRIANNFYSELSQEMTNFFVKIMAARDHTTMFLTSNNLAYRTEAIRNAGGFDKRFQRAGGEERALNAKIVVNGGKSVLVPDIVVDHYHEMTARKFFRQQRNYGRGAFIMYRVVGREMNSPPPAIPMTVYVELMRSFFNVGILAGTCKTLVFITAQLMATIGYFAQAASPRVLDGKR